jgi:A/G-specific adenine glycosylase
VQSDDFRELVWQKGRELYRDMPWRQDTRPYYVLVSELMLQQTQVSRVIPKFNDFIGRFPSERELADASLADVLMHWQGLGYNRRAKFLHDTAKRIVNDFKGMFPDSEPDIRSLPGVGANTTGAVLAYAFNQPSIFVETNVRTVYIHHFFADELDITDEMIRKKLHETIDSEHPREFYWALMDYGSYLKANGIKNNSQSRHYKKQSPLEGSVRQVRGMIIRRLGANDMAETQLANMLSADSRFDPALSGLIKDGLVTKTGDILHLTK